MAKILLVEDDNNLREIYGARLTAEGYDIVSAPDGEEALAIAVKERPDLIIADIMMPKISGFDMLDILRNAPETKNTKIVMMTALSQAEDKDRADKLGADLYLVKSQVTLEDVVDSVRKLLGETTSDNKPDGADAPAAPAAVANEPKSDKPEAPASEPEDKPTAPTEPAPQLSGQPVAPPPEPENTPKKIEVTAAPEDSKPAEDDSSPIGPNLAEALADEEKTIKEQIKEFEEAPAAQPAPTVIKPSSSTPAGGSAPLSDNPEEENPNKRIIQPLNDPTKGPDLDALAAKENSQTPEAPGPSATIEPDPSAGNKPESDKPNDFGKISL